MKVSYAPKKNQVNYVVICISNATVGYLLANSDFAIFIGCLLVS